MAYIIIIALEVAFAAVALMLRFRIIWPIAVTLIFAALFANLLDDRPLPRLW